MNLYRLQREPLTTQTPNARDLGMGKHKMKEINSGRKDGLMKLRLVAHLTYARLGPFHKLSHLSLNSPGQSLALLSATDI